MWMLLLAGLVTVVPPRATVRDVPSVDAAFSAYAVAPLHGREPLYDNPTPRPATPPDHTPWWVYASLGCAVVLLLVAVRPRKNPDESNRLFSAPLKPGPSEPVSPPRTTLEYAQYLGDPSEPKSLGTPRTPEQCHALYIAGLERLIRRATWPETVQWTCAQEAPVETRWRAWIGPPSGWDKALVRASGRTQGMALKQLLRAYNAHGGMWVAHALDESNRVSESA